MNVDLGLRCRCGELRGTVMDASPRNVTHLRCYCDDCRAFLRHLERTDLFDERGASLIVHMAPARLRIEKRQDVLRCVRLSPKGLIRWYSQCCNTPIANTVSARVPFVGVLRAGLEESLQERGGADAVLGTQHAVHGRFALGGAPAGVAPKVTAGTALRIARLIGGWWIGGLGKPSPFFDERTGAPRVEPIVLSREQRERLRDADR